VRDVCEICPHHCGLEDGHIGFCGGRTNVNGKVTCTNYGKLTSIALDPIEKKPLARFMPGSMILSVGSYGCNLRCPFCQNCEISMADGSTARTVHFAPEELVNKALELKPEGNIGIAYTYNEPFIGYEYVFDCAGLAHERGLKNVLVTNGYVCEKPLRDILPAIDAMNIDLKGFTEEFYKSVRGDLETVKRTISIAAKSCHVEVTTLVIPDENDSPSEMEELSAWLSGIDAEIPLHISRFFPRYQYAHKSPTAVGTVYRLADIARKKLKHVYTGNC
jgi:pyruvate formate lyase activating enzyme